MSKEIPEEKSDELENNREDPVETERLGIIAVHAQDGNGRRRPVLSKGAEGRLEGCD